MPPPATPRTIASADLKPKAKGTSRVSKPRKSRKSAARSKSAPKALAKAAAKANTPASRLIDQRIRDLGTGGSGWRGQTLARMRALILEADPTMTEEVKWRGTPVWSRPRGGGIVCTGEAYAKVVKLTFARGASLPDPSGLFNSSLEGNTRRAIDIHEGQTVDAAAFKTLVKAAVAQNESPANKVKSGASRANPKARETGRVKLLSGGNPQIAKADGDAAVQAYIAAMPGWKRDVGRRLDALIVRTVPNVRKAVRWNTPFYGAQGQGGSGGWFLGFHCITKYVKVAFFRGASLRPLPPGESKQKDVRYLDIYEDDRLDEDRVASWIRQASELPGEALF